MESFLQIGVNIKHIWNHHLDVQSHLLNKMVNCSWEETKIHEILDLNKNLDI